MSKRFFVFRIVVAKNVPKMDLIGKSDPYVIAFLLDQDDKRTFKTQIISNTFGPKWNEDGYFQIDDDYSKTVQFIIYDEDIKNDDKIGSYFIKMSDVAQKLTGINDEWVDLELVKKKKESTRFHIKYCITDFDDF